MNNWSFDTFLITLLKNDIKQYWHEATECCLKATDIDERPIQALIRKKSKKIPHQKMNRSGRMAAGWPRAL